MTNNIGVNLHRFLLEAGMQVVSGKLFADIGFGPIGTTIDYRPEPYRFENKNASVLVLGTPVLGDAIAIEKVAEKLAESWNDQKFLRSVNSEFLFVVADKMRKTLNIISSRFVSPPFFYYSENDLFIGSFAFHDLWEKLRKLDLLDINQQGLYELLAYKRVFGHKTHDKHSKLIEPASIVSFDGTKTTIQKYWTPDFKNKFNESIADEAAEFGRLIEQAIKRKTSDQVRPVLFLSGGMDTRSLLASFAKLKMLPLCVTVNQFENREVQVARKIAETVGAQHRFFPFHEKHYSRFFDKALALVGGMQLPFCMFLGFKELIEKDADVIFHGHGFDYMFQGMYLTRKHYHLMGKPLFYSRMKAPTGALDDFFIKNVSYGIINHNPHFSKIIKKEKREAMHAEMMIDISHIGELAKEYCDNPFDMLEYYTFYNFARHYPFGDHWGMNTNLPQRTIAFDNDLYDFYQQLPPEHRFDGRIFKKYLMDINPELGKMISANNRYPVCSSNKMKTWYQIKEYFQRKLSFSKVDNETEDFERMGTPTNYLLVDELRNYSEEVLNSGRLATLDFIDMDGVKQYVEWFFKNYREENGQLMMALITVDQLLKRTP